MSIVRKDLSTESLYQIFLRLPEKDVVYLGVHPGVSWHFIYELNRLKLNRLDRKKLSILKKRRLKRLD